MKRLLLLSGAGTSIAFGFPPTAELTDSINSAARQEPYIREIGGDRLLDQIIASVRSTFRGPITFEHLWQAILDVATYHQAPDDPQAFDEFRPIINATHQLRPEIEAFGGRVADPLLDTYIKATLEAVLSCSTRTSQVDPCRDPRSLRVASHG